MLKQKMYNEQDIISDGIRFFIYNIFLPLVHHICVNESGHHMFR